MHARGERRSEVGGEKPGRGAMTFAGKILAWTIFVPLAGLLAWRIVGLNMADYYAQTPSKEATAAALNWRADHPKALMQAGIAAIQADPQAARAYLEGAARANPAEGRSMALLGALREAAGDRQGARRAMDSAGWLSPQRTDVQAVLANYWLRQGDLGRALGHLNVVLRHGTEGAQQYYALLLKLAEEPRHQAAFAPLLKEKLAWWPGFFAYAAENATRLDSVRMLYHVQGNGPNAGNDSVLRSFLARLQREGAVTEAYFAWLNSLPKDRLGQLGNIYNGGFELPISDLGFDWQRQRNPAALMETSATYGATGSKALHIAFNGQRIHFQNIAQQLMLAPGTYRLIGRVRPDSLQAERGMQWHVYCLGGATSLGGSERFVGSEQWRHFSSQFKVPPSGCSSQILRLELMGNAALDYEATGGIWFDDMAVERID
jgi:hypothetical protein